MVRQLRTLLIDLGLILLATVAAQLLRDNLELSPDRLLRLLPYLGLTLAVAVPTLLALRLHKSVWRLSAMADYQRAALAAVVIVLATMALDFAVERLDGIARSLPILQALLMAVLMVGARVLMRLRHAGRQRGPAAPAMMPPTQPHRLTVLVVGLNRIAELYLQSVAELGGDRVTIAGLLGRGSQHTGRLVQMQTVLGTPEEVIQVLRELEVRGVAVDRIVVTVAFAELSPEARDALLEIERETNIRIDLFAEQLNLDGRPSAPLAQASSAGDAARGRRAGRRPRGSAVHLHRR